MAEDLTDRRDAVLLAAALREVAGVELDPTTESGAVETGRVVWELMRDQTLLQRLLAVLARLQEEAADPEAELQWPLGPVATTSEVFPDLPTAAPPIGSAEFERYVDELVRTDNAKSCAASSATSGQTSGSK
jgi:hypothetical protein